MNADLSGIKVLFVAGFGPVTQDIPLSKSFYTDLLHLPLKPLENNSDYWLTGQNALDGVKHFALWPLSQAAYSCFACEQWPAEWPIPQAWIEFEVRDISEATAILCAKGYHLLVAEREEPWGQTVTRLLSPEGLLAGITVTPWLRQESP